MLTVEQAVPGDPASVRRLSGQYADAASDLRQAHGELRSIASSASSIPWEGRTATAFTVAVRTLPLNTDALARGYDETADALRRFAAVCEPLASVAEREYAAGTRAQQQIASLRKRVAAAAQAASTARSAATRAEIAARTAEADPRPEATPEQAVARSAAGAAARFADSADREVASLERELRQQEVELQRATRALEDLREQARNAARQCAQVVQDARTDTGSATLLAWAAKKLGLTPPEDLGGLGQALWGTGLTLTGLGVASSWMTRVVYGRFAPRSGGLYVPIHGVPWWKDKWRRSRDRNWQAKPYRSADRGRWNSVGKWAGRAGNVASLGTSAYEQWHKDGSDPTLSTAERTGRAGTKGATTAAGAFAGAWAGAQVGGTIGTFVGGPVGTVVGGAIGGLVGGAIGSEIGGKIGDAVKDSVGRAADVAADKIDDVADEVVDALSFWD